MLGLVVSSVVSSAYVRVHSHSACWGPNRPRGQIEVLSTTKANHCPGSGWLPCGE
jgi:hypothetical protein